MIVPPRGSLFALAGGNDSPSLVVLLQMKAGRGTLGGDLVGRRVRYALCGLRAGAGTGGARSEESADENRAEERASDGHGTGIGKISAIS